MRTHVRGALGALLAIALAGAPGLGRAATITILYVNDSHSHLEADGPKDVHLDGTLGGLAKAATVIATLKATEPNALFVHAGDLFNGDLYFVAGIGPGGTPALSVPELQLLAQLGLDVMTVGNHELGLGTDTLAAVLGGAFPSGGPSVLTANVDLVAAGLSSVVSPNAVKEIGGVKVGFFGMTAIDFLSQGAPFLSDSFTAEGIIGLAAGQVAELRGGGAEVVVFLSHLGFELDQAIAANVPGIDAVVGGHDHLVLAQPVMVAGPLKSVPVLQAGEYYEWVGRLTLEVEGGQVSLAGYELVPVDAKVARLPEVAGAVEELQAAISQRYGEDFWHAPLAYALADVAKDPPVGSPLRDSAVGDLIADALRAAGHTDMGLTVSGFLTEGLFRGRLVRDDAFRIVGDGIDPDGNVPGFPLFRLRIDGRNLLAALETSLAAGGDFFFQGSGLTIVFDSRKPAGSRLVAALVNGRPVNPLQTYSATVNLGFVRGLEFFPDVQVETVEPLGTSEYAAVRDWLAHRRLVLYFSHGRSVDLAQLR